MFQQRYSKKLIYLFNRKSYNIWLTLAETVEEINDFEILFRDFNESLTKEDIDKLLDSKLNLGSQLQLSSIGVVMQFAFFIFQGLLILKEYEIGAILELVFLICSLVVFLWFATIYPKSMRKFNAIEAFNQYLSVRKKLTNIL